MGKYGDKKKSRGARYDPRGRKPTKNTSKDSKGLNDIYEKVSCTIHNQSLLMKLLFWFSSFFI